MIRYLAGRLFWGLFILACVVSLVFVLIFVAGDPAATTLGPQASAEQIADFKRKKGLDQSMATQYLSLIHI